MSIVNGRVPASEALREGWSEAEVCAGELPLRGRPGKESNLPKGSSFGKQLLAGSTIGKQLPAGVIGRMA